MNLDGRTAVVTGSASGIGLASAEALARAGAHVILADIAVDRGEEEAARLRAEGLNASFVALDVTDDVAVANFATEGREVDIVVNCAGWGKIEPFIDNSPEFWDRVIAINLTGPIKLTRALLPQMIARKSGKVVNVSSDAGRVGSLGETVYSGAKAGILGFSKALAREMARHGITVNCVCPGPTDTPLLAAVPDKHREALQRAIPMRRFAKPSEVADAVLFFSSNQSDYVTGQVLSVSGGLTMVG